MECSKKLPSHNFFPYIKWILVHSWSFLASGGFLWNILRVFYCNNMPLKDDFWGSGASMQKKDILNKYSAWRHASFLLLPILFTKKPNNFWNRLFSSKIIFPSLCQLSKICLWFFRETKALWQSKYKFTKFLNPYSAPSCM